MAYQGAYGNTAVPQQTGGGNWYDILTKLLSGLKGAGQGIGQGIGAAGQGAAGALSSIGPQLPEILKILGSIGKGVGQTATMVGRQLPYAGPLVQAGEYGILNAVGKEDSPWAQGNAFIQRDKVNKEQELMAQLMRLGKEAQNTQTNQANEQQSYEVSRRPFEENKAALGFSADEQDFQKGGLDLKYSEERLRQIQKEIADIEEQDKVLGPTAEAEFKKKKLQLELDALKSGIARDYALAGRNERYQPPRAIPGWIDKSAKEYAKTHTVGVNPLTYDISTMTPQTQAAFDASYQKKFNELLDTYNKQQGMSGGWSIIPQGSTSTAMPGTADVQAGETANANASFVDGQIKLFWAKVQQTGQDPQTVLTDFVAGGVLDPSDPDEAEVIRQIKEQAGAMAK